MPQKTRQNALKQQIDENLRRVYQEKVEEAVPDRFQNLLKQLREQEYNECNGRDIEKDKSP